MAGGTGTIGSAVVAGLSVRHEGIVAGRKTGTVSVDLASPDSIHAMFQSVETVDAVASAAGQAKFGSLDELRDAGYLFSFWNRLMGQADLVRIGRLTEGLKCTSHSCKPAQAMMSVVSPFTIDQAIILTRFLSASQRPKDTLTYPQLAGFLFGLANGPELVPPSEWIPLVFNDQDARYETEDEASQVLQAMMALYNDCVRERTSRQVALPPGCEIRPEPMENLRTNAPLSQWAQGFGMGYDYLAELWDAYTPDELDEALGALLITLTFFSSPALAEAYYEEGNKKGTLDQLATSVMEIFPEAMREYAHLGRSIYHARLETGDVDSEPLLPAKIGRNDPCLCGSGKKFKKCCGLANGTGPEPIFH